MLHFMRRSKKLIFWKIKQMTELPSGSSFLCKQKNQDQKNRLMNEVDKQRMATDPGKKCTGAILADEAGKQRFFIRIH